MDCDFSGGDFCGYYESRTDDFDWSLGSGPISSTNTGPASDHTTGTGYYIYIQSALPRLPGDKAVLMSAVMAPTGSVDNIFLLSMY